MHSTWRESLVWAVLLIPRFQKSDFPLICRSTCGLAWWEAHKPPVRFLRTRAPLHKTFCQTFFCHRKTLANLYANCNGPFFFLRSFLSFCRPKKKTPAKLLCNGAQLFVDQGHAESGLFMLLRNTMAIAIITLGFMTFEVWHERDSGKAEGGGGGCAFLKRESSKWGVRPHFVYQTAVPPKREIFVM